MNRALVTRGGRPTDDVSGPAFRPNTDMEWATFVAGHAFETAPAIAAPRHVDNALYCAGFAVMSPYDFEETCLDVNCVAVVDVGENIPIPVAICAHRRLGGMAWSWRVCSNERRRA